MAICGIILPGRYYTLKLTITKSKNAVCFYVQKTVRKDGKVTTVTVEKLGNLDQVKTRAAGTDPYEWARNYVEELNRKQYEEQKEIIISRSPQKLIRRDEQQAFNIGYLFLQDIYYELGLDKICRKIEQRYSFSYDLNDILSRLVYTRILFPSSKLSSMQLSHKLLEQPSFELQDLYRSLSVFAQENDFIQEQLYKNSQKVLARDKEFLYYDTTNYYFEIEAQDDFRRYGKSKEHKPNPIVGMGLFMDRDGIPISCTVFPGSNEKPTILPLERKILQDYGMDKVVVCTDAGLATKSLRKFNNLQLGKEQVRSFITVQSLKQLKEEYREWALAADGWHLPGSEREFSLTELDESADRDKVFYKERWLMEDISAKKQDAGVKPLEQRLIVSYSIKYRDYLQSVRKAQVERANAMIEKGESRKGNEQNDPARFIANVAVTKDGEVCEKEISYLDTEKIFEEEKYDGFYAVCTNLEKQPVSEILKINKKRWEIEECFRIMKTDFLARPVFLQRQDRIRAHFLTCYIALFIYRILEKKLEEKYTCTQLLSTLKEMMAVKAGNNTGYLPAYTRTEITDALHETFGFRTDYEITTNRGMRTLIGKTKK